MSFSKLVENVRNIRWDKADYLSTGYLLYEHCLDFAIMNVLSENECDMLVTLFSEYLAKKLLQEGYASFTEMYKKLQGALITHGEVAYAARETLHQLGLNATTLDDGGKPFDQTKFTQNRHILMHSLADTNALIPREQSLNQFYMALNKIFHLSLCGYQNIDYPSHCNLIAEALQYACMGLSMASTKNHKEKITQFELLINVALAHYFVLHMKPEFDKKTTFMLKSLYKTDNCGRLSILKHMLDAADTLLLHAAILAQKKTGSETSCINLLQKACWLYNEITMWGKKYQAFNALGTKALLRLNAITCAKENIEAIAGLPKACKITTVPSLIPWKQNRATLKTMREQAKNYLMKQPIGNTPDIVATYNQNLINLLRTMFAQCLTFIGCELPFAYAVLIMGSPARKEACPGSDIEYAFLVESNTTSEKKHKKTGTLFLGLFELAICALCETPYLNRLNQLKITLTTSMPSGLHLDKNYSAFSNLSMQENLQLWGNTEQLLSATTIKDLVTGTMMYTADLLLANKSGIHLYQQFSDKRARLLQDPAVMNQWISGMLHKGNLYHITPFLQKTTQSIHIKDQLLRLPGYLLNILCLKAGIDARITVGRLAQLEHAGIISTITTKMIHLQWMLGLRLRYLAHFYYCEENDTLHLSPPSTFLDENTVKILMSLRAGIMPVLHTMLLDMGHLPSIDSLGYHASIPAVLIIANDYFERKDFKKAFDYHNQILLLCSNVTKNEEKIKSLLQDCLTKLLTQPKLPIIFALSVKNYLKKQLIDWDLIHHEWYPGSIPRYWNSPLSSAINQGLRLLCIAASYNVASQDFWVVFKEIHVRLATSAEQNCLLDELAYWCYNTKNVPLSRVALLLKMYYDRLLCLEKSINPQEIIIEFLRKNQPNNFFRNFLQIILSVSGKHEEFLCTILQKILQHSLDMVAIQGKQADFEKMVTDYFSNKFWNCNSQDDYECWFMESVPYLFLSGLPIELHKEYFSRIPSDYRSACIASANAILNTSINQDCWISNTIFEKSPLKTIQFSEFKICLMSNDENISTLIPYISSITTPVDRVFFKQLEMICFEQISQQNDRRSLIKYWCPLQEELSFYSIMKTFFEPLNPTIISRKEKMENFFKDSDMAILIYQEASLTHAEEEISRWVTDFLENTFVDKHTIPVLFFIIGTIPRALPTWVTKINPVLISITSIQNFFQMIPEILTFYQSHSIFYHIICDHQETVLKAFNEKSIKDIGFARDLAKKYNRYELAEKLTALITTQPTGSYTSVIQQLKANPCHASGRKLPSIPPQPPNLALKPINPSIQRPTANTNFFVTASPLPTPPTANKQPVVQVIRKS